EAPGIVTPDRQAEIGHAGRHLLPGDDHAPEATRPLPPIHRGRYLLRGNESRQGPFLPHPLGHLTRLLTGLEAAHAHLVVRLAIGSRHRDEIRVEAGGRERTPNALGLAAILENPDLHGPVAGPRLPGARPRGALRLAREPVGLRGARRRG